MPRAATIGRIELRPSIASRNPPTSPTTLRGGHAHLVEHELAGVDAAHAHLVVGAADADARPRPFDDEARDVGVLARVGRTGLGEHAVPVGLHDTGHPALRAGEHPVVAVAHGLGAHADDVAAGLRLGQAEAGPHARPSRRRARTAASAPRCPRSAPGPVGRRVSSSISAAVLEYFATSSIASVRPMIPAPPPPYSSGTTRPSRPVSRNSSKRSCGYAAVVSISRARGATFSCAILRTVACSSASSGVRSNCIARQSLRDTACWSTPARPVRRVCELPALRRWRMTRRRSFAVYPPHTPSRSRITIACSKHASRTMHEFADLPWLRRPGSSSSSG